ncbi:intein-containing Rv2578c family radical SAM protein [Pseudonocardia alaniniphila]|uniref:Intein-containing Rv2578c family radical SAM protein n=1 Tax=Pseudonocardia alaniniphila TaxID=75291 RepID=A0ABS9TIV4_9PSEU|nr:intein-containing Rv2578c family radical SAM protein [Pseudonocardia alaniniphila]MCH6168353.1 intein-containing Rv2578c family radical SAM protein [Pseudonocardia alaniniphila]
MRWSGQQVLDDGIGAEAALPGMRGLLRSVRTPEFAGTVFHEVEAKSVLNRVPGSSPVPFRWTVNPYRGCSHACVYCLAGSTRVLLADGRVRPIAQLRVGDAVMGTEVVGGQRRYVPTTVLAHWSTSKPAYRVRLAGGTELVASGEHRFLSDRGWRHVSGGWCRSGLRPRLRPGAGLLGPGPEAMTGWEQRPHTAAYRQGYLCGLVRADGPVVDDVPGCGVDQCGVDHREIGHCGVDHSGGFPSDHLELEALGRVHHFLAEAAQHVVELPVAVPAGGWEPGRIAAPTGRGGIAPITDVVRWPENPGVDWNAGFLAGVVDARGAVEGGELRIRHTAPEIVRRVTSALRRLGLRHTVHTERHAEGGRRAVRTVRLLGGAGALLRLVRLADPAVGKLRDLGGAPVSGGAELAVESVQSLGVEMPMYDITTGTGDFVAEGVISHNCFARNTHTYLEFDAGADFDSQIVVKVNVARVLERELRAPRWGREPVAMGTNTDPYQRAEGRYRLMPGVIRALAGSGTPFSLLTKGTVLSRDLPLITAAAADVPVGLGVSIALVDRSLQSRLEPGTPSPAARLDLVRRISDAGLSCGVMVAPVLPLLTDSAEALDALLAQVKAAGATGATVLALHLRPGTREWFLDWLAREHPTLVEPYARLYRRGAYVDPAYRHALAERVAPLLRRHGLSGAATIARGHARSAEHATVTPPSSGEQLRLM